MADVIELSSDSDNEESLSSKYGKLQICEFLLRKYYFKGSVECNTFCTFIAWRWASAAGNMLSLSGLSATTKRLFGDSRASSWLHLPTLVWRAIGRSTKTNEWTELPVAAARVPSIERSQWPSVKKFQCSAGFVSKWLGVMFTFWEVYTHRICRSCLRSRVGTLCSVFCDNDCFMTVMHLAAGVPKLC